MNEIDKDAYRGRVLFTIGHSNHTIAKFVELLKEFCIEVVADVRSSPYSKFSEQFNKGQIEIELQRNNIQYVYLGNQLGGKPKDPMFYDNKNRVLYNRVAESSEFLKGINRLLIGITKYRVAVMCSEENPTECHRRLLISKVLEEKGVEIRHIRGSGSCETETECKNMQSDKNHLTLTLPMEELKEESSWKSTRSVLPKKLPKSSSKH